MGKQNKDERENRARLAAERKRQKEAAERRRKLTRIGAGAVAVVLLGALVFAIVQNKSTPDAKDAGSGKASAEVVRAVTEVPSATFDQVGIGATSSTLRTIEGEPLTADGKPKVLYVGGEFCPYCAAERWAVVAALSRFGTFQDLGQTYSSASDVSPNTPSLSFHGSSYTSEFLSFTGVETSDREGQPLDALSADDSAITQQWNLAKYTGGSDGSIPFMAIGGRWLSAGASFSPDLLANLDQSEVAAELAKPDSPIAQAVLGSANELSASFCTLTDQQPAEVCTSAGVRAAAANLPK